MDEICDLLVIGGGINGCGIARDAAGRGLSVTLVEKDDLAQGTSSGSTKLFHGGLRYLEYLEFRLVREALREREVLIRAMPHISWPLRFVLPVDPQMRFDGSTPVSRMLAWVMPWARGTRPAWLIRLALFLYDHMGGREILPGTRTLDLARAPEGLALRDGLRLAYEYSDGWVDDARLVALNARDAAQRGARVLTHTRVTQARVENGHWSVTVEDADGPREIRARMLVNAAGPWVAQVIAQALGLNLPGRAVRLVRGSHIVTRRLFDHDKAYFFQGRDGRIAFAIPYEQDFTLIGTTDADHDAPDTPPVCTDGERDYLLALANQWFRQSLSAADVVWTYSGVRPLFDDGSGPAAAVTRDYKLELDSGAGATVLHVFGGKITTYRKLAESALHKIAQVLPVAGGDWTARAALPGGDFAHDGVDALVAALRAKHGFLSDTDALRLVRAYGTDAARMLERAQTRDDLGQDFGAGLSAREVDWLITREFARTAQDVVWRRSKLGLRLSGDQIATLDAWMAARLAARG
jgi:glycerol-3-phosphate dehydrogenase